MAPCHKTTRCLRAWFCAECQWHSSQIVRTVNDIPHNLWGMSLTFLTNENFPYIALKTQPWLAHQQSTPKCPCRTQFFLTFWYFLCKKLHGNLIFVEWWFQPARNDDSKKLCVSKCRVRSRWHPTQEPKPVLFSNFVSDHIKIWHTNCQQQVRF